MGQPAARIGDMHTDTRYPAFLGRGLGFPPTFNKDIRDIQMSEGEVDVQESISIILATWPGERILEPAFGCNLERFVFEAQDRATIAKMRDVVETALIMYEPRIDVNEVAISTDESLEGRVIITIDYTVRSTNTRYNYVYPFYLKEGTDLNL